MAIYRNVQLSFWTDNKVEDDFTPEDKYFYIYLLTNPQTNICGCYEVSYSQMTRQTGYNKDTVNRLLERFDNCPIDLGNCDYVDIFRSIANKSSNVDTDGIKILYESEAGGKNE